MRSSSGTFTHTHGMSGEVAVFAEPVYGLEGTVMLKYEPP